MKRFRKQIIAACLVAVLFASAVLVPAKPAYAIAGVDDAAFILAMLAAAGAGYVGYNCFNGGTNPQDDFNQRLGEIEDTLKDCYDKTIAYILTQGGGGGNPDDFDPDNDDPEKKLTTWEKLKQWWKKHPNASLSLMGNASVLAAVAPVFKKNIDEKAAVGNVDISSLDMPDALLSWFSSNLVKYPYYYIVIRPSGLIDDILMASESLVFYRSSYSNKFYCFSQSFTYFHNKYLYVCDPSDVSQFSSGSNFSTSYSYNSSYSSNVPFVVYDSKNEALKAFKGYASNLNPNSTLTTDAAKKAQEDEEKKDKPVYDNVVLPTEEQMNDYINKLNEIAQRTTDPAQRLQEQQKAMNAFVESITNVSPNPEPSPDPNPNPSPDPSPDPAPSPNPSPEPDPDAPATDEEAAQYTADLTTIFPFCIPFDLIRAFKVLSVQGEAPVYDIPLKIDYKYVHVNESWSIDMSDFSSVIQILRVMETLGFIVGLILVTRKLIRG